MFGESTAVLLFLAIVGLTVVSTIDLVMQPSNKAKAPIKSIDVFDRVVRVADQQVLF